MSMPLAADTMLDLMRKAHDLMRQNRQDEAMSLYSLLVQLEKLYPEAEEWIEKTYGGKADERRQDHQP